MPLPRPGRRIPHRRTRTSRSPLLLREIRRGFSEERNFHLEFPVTPLKFQDPLIIGRSLRDRLAGGLLPVRFHPESQSRIVNPEFPRHLGNRKRTIDHLPGGLLLELSTVTF